ncbi:MAG: hypothetical protein KKB20_18855 [Proteobacteria bacterium]|nr:hypothetical protein [Pseudomonadota bacterium]
MKAWLLLPILVGLWLGAGVVMAGPIDSAPRSLGDWRARNPDEVYDRDTLYDYIDGGAELYLSYDFREVHVRRYAGPDGSEIVMDVYDMGRPDDAFGVFSVERMDEEIGLGQGSEYGGGLLRFWKGRFFVSLLGPGDEKTSRPAMMELAGAVARALPASGSGPELLTRLPAEGLAAQEVRFFRSAGVLNRLYFLADRNILQLDRECEGVLARYGRAGAGAFLILIRYPSRERADRAHASFMSAYLPEARDAGEWHVEDGTWTLVRRRGRLLALVLDAGDPEYGRRLLRAVFSKGKPDHGR